MSTSPAERIARLEVQILNLEQDIHACLVSQRDIDAKLDAVLSKIERYEGKLGGVLLAVSAISTFVIAIGGWLWPLIKAKLGLA